jgi:corrinoid protein of di/trimethylamine methyltransferase
MEAEIIEKLRKAILEYDSGGAVNWARKAVEEKVDPIKAFDAMKDAISQVGDSFGKGELWLPDLVGAADAMTAAAPIIEDEIKRRGVKKSTLGIVVIGTVLGDIHNIGKIMVATLLTAEGFDVHDLGVNISAEQFIEAIKEHNPDVLAMSALMTTTAPEQTKVITALKENGIREKVKVMVGGGGITAEFAESIGADGYDPTAPGGAKLARKLVGK